MKYSIIIPCYNEADNIGDMIDKIRPLQSSYNIQFVIVENGSTDNSKTFIKENIEGKYSKIDVVYVQANKGYGYGLQQGLKVSDGDYIGWIHADLQISPSELKYFFDKTISNNHVRPMFCKGVRLNRSIIDNIFTVGQSVFDSLLFGMKLYDIGAIPVLFHRSLLDMVNINEMPNDFSIELFIYKEAVRLDFNIIRHKVKLMRRARGESSWNNGLLSRLRLSKKILLDSFKIKRGEKVL